MSLPCPFHSSFGRLTHMTIRLRPELEDQVRRDAAAAGYADVDAYVAEVLTTQHQHEVWIAEHHAEILAKIEEGWSEAERGELMDSDEVKLEMKAMKQSWLRNSSAA